MANTIKIKRSAVPAKVPTTGDLDLGELALNTYDGKLYTKKDDGTASVVEIGAGGSGGSSTLTISEKTGAYTVVAGDLGTIINCTSGTFTVSLTAAATLGAGFNCWIWNTSTTAADAITIDPNGTETLDGRTTGILRRGEGLQIVCDGTNFQTGDKKRMRGYAENISVGQSPPTASGDLSIAIGADTTASATAGLALGYNTQSTSSNGAAIGSNSGSNGSRVATGSGAMALGGSYASGTDSFAAAVANNTVTYGAQGASSVAIGDRAKATGAGSIAFGDRNTSTGEDAFSAGENNTASGPWSVAMGRSNTASGSRAVALGDSNTASNFYTVALGSLCEATQNNTMCTGSRGRSNIQGKRVHSSSAFSGEIGSAQTGDLVLGKQTADATPVALSSVPGNAAGSLNQIILPNNSAYAFHGTIVARQQASGGTACAAWKIEGLIRREGSAGTTVLVNSTTTVLDNTPAWGMALSADTTNGGLKIEVTGAAATNIRWVATISTSECTY